MGLLKDVKEIFGVENLYDVFGVDKSCTIDKIKKAYRRRSLLCHPDKAPPNLAHEFTRKFQTLCKSYDILQDKEKRKVYDETGDVEDGAIESNQDWEKYWRNLFPKVTEKQIDDFMAEYIGSEKEREDLKRIYEQCKGDMNKIAEYHFGYFNFDHEARLNSLLNEMIKSNEIENLPAFSKESAAKKRRRKQKYENEATEASLEDKAKKTKDEVNSLSLVILANQRKRAAESEKFLADLEAKYAPKPKKRQRKQK